MIPTYDEKRKTFNKAEVALNKIKKKIEKQKKDNKVSGPFYKNGCIIYCSKSRLEEVKEKFKLDEK